MDVVDVWMQHPTRRFLQQPMFDSLRRWTGQSLDGEVPVETTLAAMDAGSISVGLLSAWYGPEGTLIGNEEVAALVRAHPHRFRGLAGVDVRRPAAAARELRRAVREDRFVGLRIVPWLWGWPADDRRYYPLYAECVELGVPVCLQVGHTGPMMSSEPGRPIPHLEHVALEFPELVIVAGHIGAPWTQEVISLATKFEHLHVDTSAYKASRYPSEFVDFMRGHGARKTMFGTNYPMLTAAACLEALPALGLAAEATAAFLAGNARRVFRLDGVP